MTCDEYPYEDYDDGLPTTAVVGCGLIAAAIISVVAYLLLRFINNEGQ